MVIENSNQQAQTLGFGKPAAGQKIETEIGSEQNIALTFATADVSGVSMGTDGELFIQFVDESVLVIKDFAEASGADDAAQVQMSDGSVLELSQLFPRLALASVQNEDTAVSDVQNTEMGALDAQMTVDETNLSYQEPAPQVEKPSDEDSTKTSSVLDKPSAGEEVVVTFEDGETYQLGFEINAPQAVNEVDGQLVISFADGGSIVIPNYDSATQGTDGAKMTLSNGTPVSASDFTDVLALASQLNDVEPAAGGDGAGGGANTGFGFGSTFQSTPLEGQNAIGPIDPTVLRYGVGFREPELEGQSIPAPGTPSIDAPDQIVFEDGSVALNVSAAPGNTDGSEQITIEISGIDPAWGVDTTASGGTYDVATGTWTITLPAGASLTGGPVLSPPANSDADMPGVLTMTVTTTQIATGATSTGNATFDILTDAVADTPDVTAANASGAEDTPIALNLSTSLNDLDGSESITNVIISNMPAGATLSAGTDLGGGNWQLTTADFAGLTVTPPANFSGSFNLTLTSTATETTLTDDEFTLTNNQADNSVPFTVTVAPVADMPTISVADHQVKEDGSVAISISASLTDRDGSEFLTVSISGIDPAWGVDTTVSGGTYDAATGTWTLALSAGNFDFTGGPVFLPPADSDADLTGLVATATATEFANGDTNSATGTFDVVTDAVIDTPTLVATDVSGAEDTAITLNIATSATDIDGSEQITNIVIGGVPTGATLSNGTDLGGGNWQLTTADLAGLTITPPLDYNGSFSLTVSSTATEVALTGSEFDLTDNEMTVIENLNVTVTPVADPPKINVDNVTVKEDGSVLLVVEASLTGPATDVLTVTLTNIDTTWGVDITGITGQPGVDTATYDIATGTITITMLPGQDFTGGPILSPPENSDVDMTGIVATATEFDPLTNTTAPASDTANVLVDAVVDTPTLNVVNASGDEDTAIALDISTAVTDLDGSEEITSVIIQGVPAGASLNNGVDLGGGNWALNIADLPGLTLTPPRDFSGSFNLTVVSTAEEVNLAGTEFDLTDNVTSVQDVLTVTVAPVADKPSIRVGDHVVKEDGSVALSVTAALADADGSEFLTVSIAGIDPAWGVDTTTSGGTYDAVTGTWTLTLPAGVNAFTGGPTLSPPADSDADMTGLVATATATETIGGDTNAATGTFNVITDAVIDTPTLDVNNASGGENATIALSITTAATDIDGSEQITNIVISGVPAGASLNNGTDLGGGNWQLTTADLTGLTITPPTNYDGTFNLTVASTATEVALSGVEIDLTDNQMTVFDQLTVTVNADADVPTLKTEYACIYEDTSVKLNINATLADTDGSEFLTVTVTNIPSTWAMLDLAGGTYDAATGTWEITLAPGQNFAGGPRIEPPADSDADLAGANALQVTATSTEVANNATASINDTIDILVDAVIDTPTLDVNNASGGENATIALSITTAATDIDGSEQITNIVVSGVPAGASLNNGTDLGGGNWQLTTADLAGLTITPPANFDGTFNLTVASTATETALTGAEFDYTNNEMTVYDTLTVTVNADADVPTLKTEYACIYEDTSVKLNINATLADTDGSEFLTVTVTNIPSTWAMLDLAGGTYDAATGTWEITLAPGQNFAGGPRIEPPADSDADLAGANALQVTATSTEVANNATASINDTIDILVDAVIDTPTLDVNNASGEEGTAIALNISTAATDIDGSEQITNIVISGVPTGASLNNGTDLGGGNWQLTTTDLAGLTITPPANFDGTFSLTVASTATETALTGAEFDYTNNEMTVFDTLTVTVDNDDEPIITRPDEVVLDETDLSTGSLVHSDTLTADFGTDAPGTFNANNSFSSTYPLTSNNVAVIILATATGYVGTAGAETIFTLDVKADGDYDFTLIGTLDHVDTNDHNDGLALNFGFDAVDSDGDMASSTLTVNVLDDGLTANSDSITYDVADGNATGNVITGLNGGPGAADDGSEDGGETASGTGSSTVSQVNFGGAVVDIPAGGSATIDGDYGTLEMFSDGTYNYTLDPSFGGGPETTYNFTIDNPPGSDASGDIKNVTTSLNADTNEFTFSMTVADPAVGFTLAINDGPNPKGTPGEMALFYFDASDSGSPIVSAYGYNGQNNFTSAFDGSPQVGTQSPDQIATSLGTNSPFSSVTVSVDANGNNIYSFTMDATVILDHVPLYGDATDWTGVNFDDLIGMWLHPVGGLSTDYGTDGYLSQWNIEASGYYDSTNETTVTTHTGGNECLPEDFGYTIIDNDGDTSSADLTINGVSSTLIVGKNIADADPSIVKYEVGEGEGTIDGHCGDDILVGDVGGAILEAQTQDYNINMILDISGSMGSNANPASQMSLMIDAVTNLFNTFNGYQGGDIKVNLAPFQRVSGTSGSFTVTTAQGLIDAIEFLSDLDGSSWTNYESGLQAGIDWLENGDAISGAKTISYFISDGEPNHYLDINGNAVNGGEVASIFEILGTTDGTNEVARLQELSDQVIAVGINIGSKIDNLHLIDSNDAAINVQDPTDLDAQLAASNPLNTLSSVGGDVIEGAEGDDIIFGDSLFTDDLATDHGLGTVPGTGWDVFAKLEAGESTTNPAWDREDTINYIRDNAEALAEQSLGSAGETRMGGNDTLNGGAGDDMIFGQEGDDMLSGGFGEDTMFGGVGADTFTLALNEGVDTIADFNTSDGDILDVSSILTSFDPVSQALSDFVSLSEDGSGNTLVQIDATGAGGSFETVAVLEGITGIDIDDLTSGGNLIV